MPTIETLLEDEEVASKQHLFIHQLYKSLCLPVPSDWFWEAKREQHPLEMDLLCIIASSWKHCEGADSSPM